MSEPNFGPECETYNGRYVAELKAEIEKWKKEVELLRGGAGDPLKNRRWLLDQLSQEHKKIEQAIKLLETFDGLPNGRIEKAIACLKSPP